MSQDIKAKMTGATSNQLFDKSKKANFLKRAEDTLRFFQGQDGQEEFWSMVSILSGEGPREGSDKLRVTHI